MPLARKKQFARHMLSFAWRERTQRATQRKWPRKARRHVPGCSHPRVRKVQLVHECDSFRAPKLHASVLRGVVSERGEPADELPVTHVVFNKMVANEFEVELSCIGKNCNGGERLMHYQKRYSKLVSHTAATQVMHGSGILLQNRNEPIFIVLMPELDVSRY